MLCYFLRRGAFVGFEVLTAGSDDALIRQACTVFEDRKDAFDGFEVWDRGRLVYRYPSMPQKFTSVPGGTTPGAEGERALIEDIEVGHD